MTHEQVLDWLRRFGAAVTEHRSELSRLDTAIGDGDHGSNMARGMGKALEKLASAPGDDIGATLKATGMALVSSVGGAAGPLYGTLFMQMGTATAGKTELSVEEWTAALEAGLAGVQMRGKAQVGDKTMVDAFTPAVAALKGAGGGEAAALLASADAAEQGMQDTIGLEARKGRASYLGERSVGHQDPGATSLHLLLRSAADAVAE